MTDSELPMDVARLVSEHHEDLYRYAYRLTGSAADAEDLTQQVFLVAHTKIGQVRDPASVGSWLYAILRNCYLKGRRVRIPLPASSVELDMDRVPAEEIDEPFDAYPIDTERLQAAINGLADEFKLVVMLYYFEERSYRDMAEILEVPMGTVMSRLSRAKAHLRCQLGAAENRDDADRGTAENPALEHGTVPDGTVEGDTVEGDTGPQAVSMIDAREPKPPVLTAPRGRA